MLTLLTLLVVTQSRPLPVATEKLTTPTFSNAKASGSFSTGMVPFELEFTCTFDYVGPINGCYTKVELDLNYFNPLDNTYTWRGRQPGPTTLEAINEVEVYLSGVQLYIDSSSAPTTVNFNELYVDAQTYKLHNNKAYWYVHVNWRNNANTMLDIFNVKISGELIWSTVNSQSRLLSYELLCGDVSDSCQSTRSTPYKKIVFAAIGKTQMISNGSSTILGAGQ